MPIGRDGLSRGHARRFESRSHSAIRDVGGVVSGLIGVALLATSLSLSSAPAVAQGGPMMPGDAVVTGFSGFKALDLPAAPPDPLARFFIDTDGNAMQVLRLQPGGPPQGQLIPAPPVMQIKAGQIGQVFAITLAPPLSVAPGTPQAVPDIYLGATSAFGIQIVRTGPDGQPQRIRTGGPAAQWMVGQFGTALGGGPGSIYRIDGQTGAASLFANLDNSGPGLGDVVYDPATHQFFASDLDSGLIHRIDVDGTLIDSFDHGLAGRPGRGLAPVPDDGKRMMIQSPAFNSEDTATWGFTQRQRMVYGMAVFAGRLYYAVAEGSEIWSIGIRLEGGFANDARWEFSVPGVPPGALITDLAFDGEGRLLVALRGAPRGSYNYSVFAERTQQTDVKRFRREVPDNPATPGYWVPVPEEYAIGFPEPFRNATGGVALGYGHDPSGAVRRASCSSFVWSTGDNLRNNPTLGAPLEVHGLQGNSVTLVRPQNAPPAASYFADYDGVFGDPERAGHIGDVEIWQPCERAAGLPEGVGDLGMFGFWGGAAYWPVLPPDWIPPPPPPPTNLRLNKSAHSDSCVHFGGGFWCLFTVRVTNTGPGDYFGPVTVHDAVAGVPPGAVHGLPPWACVPAGPGGVTCTHPPVLLHPGDSIDLLISVHLPANFPGCSINNNANLVWPPGGGDINPGDDADNDSMAVPGPNCGGTNLRMEKTGSVCTAVGGMADCSFVVIVHNEGPGAYAGNITVTDTVPAGTMATFSPPWICGGGPPTYTCTLPGVNIPPGGVVHMQVHVRMPLPAAAHVPGCQVTNESRITVAAGGSVQNSNAGDDQASATLNLPPDICPLLIIAPAPPPPPPPPPPSPTTCPPGFVAKGSTCEPRQPTCPAGWTIAPVPGVCCPPGQPWTGRQCGQRPLPPPPTLCREGWTPTPIAGMCCPPGQPWTGKRCGRDEPPPSGRCQPGWTPTPIAGMCCPPGQPWTGKRCGRDEPPPRVCPQGMIGTPPNCRAIERRCPTGMVGTPPNCRAIERRCPSGMVGTPPNCRAIERRCPPGMVGTPPNCRRIERQCPSGTTGTPPNCRPILIREPTHR
ncbi:hypothetical protein KMZ29_17325 [Bradyrhizobium sediminis]|uniref:DUF11 domain-containing protein n=1 Tax=Bradyrhizobium sediminis TaxID=2840469 RepID=A0A975RLA0_9BRAD|nr:hypothetical protein [Bradyrhizobium sediminis]QWG11489.1 hypothetical protein KMZ29_17325 [Bradyrhizobium sediminis]